MINNNNHPIWSWIVSFVSSTPRVTLWNYFTSISYNPLPLQELPENMLGEILDYLLPNEVGHLLRINKAFFEQLNDSDTLENRRKEALFCTFRKLVAIEGEDNQNKAEAVLRQYPDSSTELITTKRKKFRDAAGRMFETPISAYGYAYWSGDTFMRHMMEQYMDEDAKTRALAECKHIAEEGLTFTLKVQEGDQETVEYVLGSRHFNAQALIQAYQIWLAEAAPLINSDNRDETAWTRADALWLDIGKEWAKVPVHIAQELCSDRPFYRPDFTQENKSRTIKFYNWLTTEYESIFTPMGVHSGLGTSFSLYKSGLGESYGLTDTRLLGFTRVRLFDALDLTAIITLVQIRTETDLIQTMDDLKQVESGVHLKR